MYALFNELADDTTAGTKGIGYSPGWEAWLILFLSVFLAMFAFWTISMAAIQNGYFSRTHGSMHELFLRAFFIMFMLLTGHSGWPAIIYYKMRNVFSIRCTVFFAVVSGTALAIWPFYHTVLDTPSVKADAFLQGIFILVLSIWAVAVVELSVARARYPYSKETGQWLRSHVTKKRFAGNAIIQKWESITFEDILALEVTRNRRGVVSPILFLDSTPEGEHYICLLRSVRQKFFTLKFSKPPLRYFALRVDLHQLKQIHERLGEFKKTTFMTPAYTAAAIGKTIRSGAYHN